VRQSDGRPFILPDKMPGLTSLKKINLKDKINIMLISSFGKDEPIKEVLDAMRHLEDKNICLYISGNHRKLNERIDNLAPKNVVLTGFLEEQDFINMLFSVDAVMVLTTIDHCMLCGCYEAVAATKPLITSDKNVLREYFKGAIFVDNTSKGISEGIRNMVRNIETYREKIKDLKEILTIQWKDKYNNLELLLNEL
jgi:glycosyltransferase involved in cell wall biosynthesis